MRFLISPEILKACQVPLRGTAGNKQGTSAHSGSISMAGAAQGRAGWKLLAGTPGSPAPFLDWRAFSKSEWGAQRAWRWGGPEI